MWCSLRDSGCLGEEQLSSIRSFLLSTTDSSPSDQKTDRDDVSSDSEDEALSRYLHTFYTNSKSIFIIFYFVDCFIYSILIVLFISCLCTICNLFGLDIKIFLSIFCEQI